MRVHTYPMHLANNSEVEDMISEEPLMRKNFSVDRENKIISYPTICTVINGYHRCGTLEHRIYKSFVYNLRSLQSNDDPVIVISKKEDRSIIEPKPNVNSDYIKGLLDIEDKEELAETIIKESSTSVDYTLGTLPKYRQIDILEIALSVSEELLLSEDETTTLISALLSLDPLIVITIARTDVSNINPRIIILDIINKNGVNLGFKGIHYHLGILLSRIGIDIIFISPYAICNVNDYIPEEHISVISLPNFTNKDILKRIKPSLINDIIHYFADDLF